MPRSLRTEATRYSAFGLVCNAYQYSTLFTWGPAETGLMVGYRYLIVVTWPRTGVWAVCHRTIG